MRSLLALPVLAVAFSAVAEEGWRRHTIDDSSRGADGVRLADVDGDGDQDVATGWEEGGRVRVYLNPGPEKSKAKWPAVTVGNVKSPEDAVLVDLDGDGATDVVSCCEGRTRTVFVHWAPKAAEKYLDESAWKTEAVRHSKDFAMWMFCLPMQVDGKRGVDLVVGSKGKGAAVGWYESPENPRDLASWKWHEITPAGWIMSLQRFGDGLLVSDRKGARRGVWQWSRTGGAEGEWSGRALGARDHEVMFLDHAVHPTVERGERLGQTRSVLVATREKAVRLSFNPLTRAQRWREFEFEFHQSMGTGKGAAIADVDGDGRPDSVFTCENAGGKHGVMWFDGSEWHPISGTKEGVKFDRIEMLDLDGDGDLDLLTCEERDNLGVIWYENPLRGRE